LAAVEDAWQKHWRRLASGDVILTVLARDGTCGRPASPRRRASLKIEPAADLVATTA